MSKRVTFTKPLSKLSKSHYRYLAINNRLTLDPSHYVDNTISCRETLESYLSNNLGYGFIFICSSGQNARLVKLALETFNQIAKIPFGEVKFVLYKHGRKPKEGEEPPPEYIESEKIIEIKFAPEWNNFVGRQFLSNLVRILSYYFDDDAQNGKTEFTFDRKFFVNLVNERFIYTKINYFNPKYINNAELLINLVLDGYVQPRFKSFYNKTFLGYCTQITKDEKEFPFLFAQPD